MTKIGSKNVLKSKTFWLNALTMVANFGGLIPVDPTVALYIVNGANIGLRVMSKGAVHVMSDAAKDP
jgi:hypothetical protein